MKQKLLVLFDLDLNGFENGELCNNEIDSIVELTT